MTAERLLIAVAVTEEGQLSTHAGRAQCWQVFDVWPEREPLHIYTIELEDSAILHEWHMQTYPERHPLHAVDVALVRTAGEGVTRRLSERGVTLMTTGELDPLAAVKAYLKDALPEGPPHDEHTCGGEGHQHDHAHD